MTPILSQAGRDLDAAVREFIARTGADHARYAAGRTLSPAEAREVAEKVRAPWRAGGPKMRASDDRMIPTAQGPLRVRIHDPDPRPGKPVLVYIHGGGWILFSLETHDRVMREYAARAGVVVVGVDYDRSPEAKFPRALNQCVAAIEWVAAGGVGPAADPARIAVGGDSVGGNMSLAAAVKLRDEGRPDVISALLLNYGAFDVDLDPQDVARYGGDGYMLLAEEMPVYWNAYLARPEDAQNPLAVPARAELAGLPPVFLTIPECDVLAGQSHTLAARLRAEKVAAQAQVYAGASHSFLEAVSISDLAARALQDGARWLGETLSHTQPAAR